MKTLVTGSSGHLGEGLVVTLREMGVEVVGIDIKDSDTTDYVGSITNTKLVKQAFDGVDRVFHTATLHKPHQGTHSKQDFVETNVSGTLCLLEASTEAQVTGFVFTSTTSVFGDALRPPPGSPAAWITEAVVPVPKNIYGATKLAAENLCRLVSRESGLNTLALRTSRFFPEEDDDKEKREKFSDANIKALEFLYRRVELEDVIDAHLKAIEVVQNLKFEAYVISANTPFQSSDLMMLNQNAARVINDRVPHLSKVFETQNWEIFPRIERVYVNENAKRDLGWNPRFDIDHMLNGLVDGKLPRSEISQKIGTKGYHNQSFTEGPYPV
ncbi:MAG: NAD-dependent epimerase/dehydratase family protein [Pseudohongiellaceae bacterium]